MHALLLCLLAQDHPWKDFAEGSSVTLRTKVEQDGNVLSTEEVSYTRGAIVGERLRLLLKRGTEDSGEELLSLAAPTDFFRDVEVKKKSKEKLQIEKTSFDCDVEEIAAKTEGGRWTLKVWYAPKASVPSVAVRSLGSLPEAKIASTILKLEAFFHHDDQDPDYTKYRVTSLSKKIQIDSQEATCVAIVCERKIERTRLLTADILVSKEVPGHWVREVTTLKSDRMPAMKTTREARSFAVKK